MATPAGSFGVLDAVGKTVSLNVAGKAMAGISVQGTFVGSVAFEESYDGDTFFAMSLKAWAAGAQTASASTGTTGGFVLENVGSRKAIRARMTAFTSGAAQINIGAGETGAQDAMNAVSDTYKNQASAANAVNTLTVSADAKRAYRLSKLVVSFSGGTPTTCRVTVKDGSGVIWDVDLPLAQGANELVLPDGGLVGTPNKSLVVEAAAGGTGVISRINAEVRSG